MRNRTANPRLLALATAWVLFALSVGLVLSFDPWWGDLAVVAPNLLVLGCGTIVVARSNQRLIGWSLVAIGIGYTMHVGALPALAAGRSGVWLVLASLGLWPVVSTSVIVMLVFPTGRFPSRAWRMVGWSVAALGLVSALVEALSSIGITTGWSTDTPVVLFGILTLIVVGMHIVDFPKRTDIEKRQVAWFLYAVFVSAMVYVAALIFPFAEGDFPLAAMFATSLASMAILVAITRYRLYEIDRIFSRTLSYAFVAGISATVFVTVVSVVSLLLPTQGDLAIAASTLTVAALFTPVRRRVRANVDRRFNRSVYESQLVVDEFASGLAEASSVQRVVTGLEAVVAETLEPQSIRVWIVDS